MVAVILVERLDWFLALKLPSDQRLRPHFHQRATIPRYGNNNPSNQLSSRYSNRALVCSLPRGALPGVF
jgi:hypothetical protein